VKIETNFEKAKVSKKDFSKIEINVPPSLLACPTKTKTFQIEQDEEEDSDHRVIVSQSQFQQMWSIVLEDTKKLVTEMINSVISKHKTLDYIYLAGGLSCSPIFQQAIKALKPANTQIMWSERPDTAIAEGAILFGNRVDLVSKRILRRTYGAQTNSVWNDTHIGRSEKSIVSYEENGIKKEIQYATKVFDVMATRGDTVAFGVPVSKRYAVTVPNQKSVSITIVQWPGPEQSQPMVQYTTEPSVTVLGTLTVDIPGEGLGRLINVDLYFGKSTIEVKSYAITNPQNLLSLVLDISE